MLIAAVFALMLHDPAPATTVPGTPSSAAAPQPVPPQERRLPLLVLPRQVPVPEKKSSHALRFVWREHPSLRAGRNFRLDFAAKFQLDSRDPGDDPVAFETYEVHRMRVGIEGELFRHIQYSVERELTEREVGDPEVQTGSAKTPWKDVFVEANYTDMAQVRVGKFKVPFGLDQTSGESNLDFVYRSLGGNYLSPGRDTGLDPPFRNSRAETVFPSGDKVVTLAVTLQL